MHEVTIPPAWAERVAGYAPDGGPPGADWVRTVPGLIGEALDRWALTVTGAPMTGWTALVLPVEQDGTPLALKVVWPHTEARQEHLALRLWDGDGAVRLIAALPSAGTLLLERLDAGRSLDGDGSAAGASPGAVWTDEACAIIGGLLRRLHRPAPPQLLTLEAFLAPSLDRMLTDPRVPRRIAVRVRSLAADLFASDERAVMLHTDLHYANVLAGEREPWLAIDPKPLAGHPGYEIQPLLRNRFDELGTGSALRWSVRHRLALVAEAMGLDVEIARAWSILHTGIQVLWCADDPAVASRHMAILKALDD